MIAFSHQRYISARNMINNYKQQHDREQQRKNEIWTTKGRKIVTESWLGSLRYVDYGLRTAAGRALSFVRSTGLSRANIER